VKVPTTLLVPVDFSATSEAALTLAVELAKPLHARLVVMHAYDVPVYGYPGTFLTSPDIVSSIRDAAQGALDAMVARFEKHDLKLETVLRQGSPSQETNAVAHELGADMIVIGTHGRSGFARLLLGSVAEKIVRSAVIPVLTVRDTAPTSAVAA
jgi:nucleotide-binding universal stress UspA family protein